MDDLIKETCRVLAVIDVALDSMTEAQQQILLAELWCRLVGADKELKSVDDVVLFSRAVRAVREAVDNSIDKTLAEVDEQKNN